MPATTAEILDEIDKAMDPNTPKTPLSNLIKSQIIAMSETEFETIAIRHIDFIGDVDPEVQQDCYRMLMLSVIKALYNKGSDVYTCASMIRYCVDETYTIDDVVKEMNGKHTLRPTLKGITSFYNACQSEKMKNSLRESANACKELIRLKETGA